MALSLEKFAASLTECGVLSTAELSAFRTRNNPADAEQLARGLVKQKLLTAYQAQQVYAGKAKALTMGNYLILDKLGQGGMGMVLKARHKRMNRVVALKVLSPAVVKTPEALARFHREVQAAARLEHQNIVIAHDADEANGAHFFVMQYVEGEDLSVLVKKNGPLPPDKAVHYVIQTARGLEFAHRQGVIHRDIKPANLLLDAHGTVKILDMGLARIEGETGANAELTSTGAVMGTVDYMAPEQALSTRSADARSDVYSLGITLWYLLTARPAYEGDSLMARLMAHANHDVPSLKAARGDIPDRLDAVYRKMVAKKPTDRFQTMTEVLAALETVGGSIPGDSRTMSAGSAGPSEDSKLSEMLAFFGGGADSSAVTRTVTVAQKGTGATHPAQGSEFDKTVTSARPDGETDATTLTSLRKTTEPQHNGKRALISALVLSVVILSGVLFSLRTRDGTLIVEVDQPDATVRVDDKKPVPVIPKDGQGTVSLAVGPGKHHLTVEKAGFEVFRKELEIQSGVETPIAAKLVPLQKAVVATSSWQGWPADAPRPAIAPFDAEQARKHQQEWAAYLKTPVEYTNSRGMKFRLIPPGEFMMGSTAVEAAAIEESVKSGGDEQNDFQHDAVQHRVILTQPFYLGANEVTQAEYEGVMGQNPSHFSVNGVQKDAVAKLDTAGHPVDGVGFADAAEFCAKLSQLEQLKPFYFRADDTISPLEGSGYRLPTEAEWEFACRAGATTKYWFGSQDRDLVRIAWFRDNSGLRTHPAGELKANPYGLFDVHGNVFEWVQDSWDPTYYIEFKEKPAIDPIGPSVDNSLRVVRGGSWLHGAPANYAAFRFGFPSELRNPDIGFRVSLTVDAVKRGGWNKVATQSDPAFQQWIKDVQSMPAGKQVEAVSRKLVELNPGFDGTVTDYEGKGTPLIENRVVREFGFLTDKVTDISPVRAFAGLKRLSCGGSERQNAPGGKLVDLSPLKGMQLTSLNCVVNRQLRDISPLAGMPLTSLTLHWTSVSDLSPLKGMPLQVLFIGGLPITDLSPLAGLKLQKLDIGYSKRIFDLTPLKDQPLEGLVLNDTAVSDLSPLKRASLTHFNCSKTQISDLSLLKEMPLWHLECDFSPERDAELIRSIKTLEMINRKPVADFWREFEEQQKGRKLGYQRPGFDQWVKDVQSMPAEKQIEAVSRKLVELNPGFDGTVTNWEGKDSPHIENGVVTQIEIITDNVTDISPVRALAGLQVLVCKGSGDGKGRLSDLTPIRDMPLRHLYLDFRAERDTGLLRSIKTLDTINFRPVAEVWREVEEGQKEKKLAFQMPGFDQWMKDVQAMPAEKQVEAVRSRLMELNPGFDGKVLAGDGKSPPKIEDGVVTELGFVTDHVTDISPVRALVGLKVLLCNGSQPGSGRLSDLSPVEGMTLENLGCFFTQVSDLAPLRRLPLRGLNIFYSKVSDLSPLEVLPLEYLDCSGLAIASLRPLTRCPRLGKLIVRDSKVTPVEIAALQKTIPDCRIEWDGSLDPDRRAADWVLSHGGAVGIVEPNKMAVIVRPQSQLPVGSFRVHSIEFVSGGPPIRDDDLVVLEGLTELRELDLTHLKGYTDAGLKSLSGLTSLTKLALFDNNDVTDLGMRHLSGLKKLEELHLAATMVTEKGLRTFVGCPLRSLIFGGRDAADRMMLVVDEFPRLTTLGVHGNDFRDAEAHRLKGLPKLTHLSLLGSPVTDEGLATLAVLKLSKLDLQAAAVTDKGLENLQGMTSLKNVWILTPHVTAAGVADLQKALPACNIVWDDPTKPK